MSPSVRASYNRGNRFRDCYLQRKETLLEAIRSYISAHGRSPSLRELQTLTGWGSPTLQGYLRRLADEGLITRQPRRARGITLIPPSPHHMPKTGD